VGKPEVAAWFMGEEIADADPLAAVKWRARDLDAAGEVLEQAARSGTVAARADRLDPLADLVADEAFTADEVMDMGRSAGLSGDELDAAAGVAWELWKVEQLRKE
jgi:hypothetical protein